MRHHWLEDRIQDNTIHLIWRPGQSNRADYFTKHHAPSHHRKMRHQYLVNIMQRQQRNFIDDYYTSATRVLLYVIQQQKIRAMRAHDTHTP